MSERWRVEWHPSLPSTMDRAAELAAAGAPAGKVIVADFQSRGRGTRGRIWTAPPGTCLMFSIVLRPSVSPDQLTNLPVCIAERLAALLSKDFGLDATVKPRNDVLVRGKKICGILCSSRVQAQTVEWVICGIGLNTTMSQTDLPTPDATSLMAEGIAVPPHRTLLDTVLAGLEWLLEPDLASRQARRSGCAAQS